MEPTHSTDSGASEIIRLARGLIGTPFAHQGRAPGVGIDCIGVVMHIAHTLGITDYDRTDYGRIPKDDELERALDWLFVRAAPSPVAGQIGLFRFKDNILPAHVGITTSAGAFVHAHWTMAKVVEQPFDIKWRRRFVRSYSFCN